MVALAGVETDFVRTAGASEIDVSLLEGRLAVSATTLTAGKITLVAVNKGKLTHGLAIMGTGLSPRRTPTIAVGKTARLTVTLKAGSYHIWDPVRSSMSHAKMLTVKAPKASSGNSVGSSSEQQQQRRNRRRIGRLGLLDDGRRRHGRHGPRMSRGGPVIWRTVAP